MEGKTFAIVLQIINLLGFIFVFNPSLVAADEEQNGMQTYIVWVEKPPVSLDPSAFALSHEDLERWYRSFFPENTIEGSKQTRIVHAYHNVATGFAAKLTPEELNAMEKKQGFVSAHLEAILPLHTTHSPNFLGLQQGSGFWKGANYGKGVIIGVLDTGISPDHPSFSDKGVPPPPAKWKGKCEFDGALCNDKLIGARSFVDGQPAGGPPFDGEGHGTHTASTAGGNFVKRAMVFGMAKGTAVGMAPYAHLAIYKVCSIMGCFEGDILAAFDAAVDDGVDVISLSVGGPSGPFYTDGIAIGAFGAIRKGIFVSCSAGNSGPSYSSLSNVAPWILTVGASTIDRIIRATTRLGNKKAYNGESLFQPKNFDSNSKLMLPLVYAGAIGNTSSPSCEHGTLENVRGKIVLCERGGMSGRVDKGAEVKRAGGAAMILVNQEIDGCSTSADPHVLPATHVSYAAGLKIKSYIKSSSKPTATILFKGTVIGDSQAPSVASFSSRGPSIPSPGILKPDIIGPGVSILAPWPVPVDNATKSKATFNIISGTSMSCPHLSGIAALLKSFHPDWSPAAIKSAIMTTADVHNLGSKSIVDQTLRPADIFAIGAGHVNPTKANDPGLIYDTQPKDYIRYLCGLKYTEKQIQIITQQKVKCAEVGSISEAQLNYPTFSLIVGSNNKTRSQLYTRTVKNVGPANSTYKLEILAPQKMNVDVSPPELRFPKANQIITYRVKFTAQKGAGKEGVSFGQGYLRWVSDKYRVTSPIAVLFES